MTWIFIILAGVGLSHVIVDSSLLAKFRGKIIGKPNEKGELVGGKGPEWLKTLISCYQCNGMWSGVIFGLISGIFINEFNTNLWCRLLFLPVIYGFATSYTSMVAAAILNYLDRPWGTK